MAGSQEPIADPNTQPAIPELKAAMRRASLARRRAYHAERGVEAAESLRARVCDGILGKAKIIAGYWPLGDEIDCRPSLAALGMKGAQVALPVVAGQGMVLLFRLWTVGDRLEPGPFGTAHPPSRAAVVEPDALLLPLIAFDRRGYRLGYGAGYYDRTVAALRRSRKVLVVGLAYDEQEVEAMPAAPHDQPMDGIITDRRTLWFERA